MPFKTQTQWKSQTPVKPCVHVEAAAERRQVPTKNTNTTRPWPWVNMRSAVWIQPPQNRSCTPKRVKGLHLKETPFTFFRFEHFTCENQKRHQEMRTPWIISFKWILPTQCWSNSGWDHLRQSQEDEVEIPSTAKLLRQSCDIYVLSFCFLTSILT